MPPASSKNRSSTIVSLVGSTPSWASAEPQVGHDRLGGGRVDPALGHQPADAPRPDQRPGEDPIADAERADLLGQLDRAARRLAEPERHRGRRSARVLDPDDAWLDPPDPPGGRPEQEDVSRHALDRPVLVDGADEGVVRLGEHAEVAELGDGAARGQRRDPGAAPGLERAVDLVPVQVGGRVARGRCGCPPRACRATSSNSSAVTLGERRGAAAPGPGARPRPTRPPRTRPRSAGPGCRAGTAG